MSSTETGNIKISFLELIVTKTSSNSIRGSSAVSKMDVYFFTFFNERSLNYWLARGFWLFVWAFNERCVCSVHIRREFFTRYFQVFQQEG